MGKTQKFYIIATYKFFTWPQGTDFPQRAQEIQKWCSDHDIKGLLLIGPEGFNGTLACPNPQSQADLIEKLASYCSPYKLEYKKNESQFQPFRRMKVKVKDEIVTLGAQEVVPSSEKDPSHLSPKEWNDFIKKQKALVLDVRNDYEMELGKFKSAKNWSMQEFTQFPELIKHLDADKEKPVLMYCTGGIRCEKASIEMRRQGFKNVYQLDGGILNYLKEFPEDEFEGECFVFDHRVAVDQKLEPSKNFGLCVHCGQPAQLKPFDCIQCGEPSIVCQKCLDENSEDKSIQTCSKNCRHHNQLGHKTERIHKDAKREYKKALV